MRSSGCPLLELYRCPKAFVSLGLQGTLSETAGFFSFGSDIICHGRSSCGYRKGRPNALLYDVSSDVEAKNSELLMPFDPVEVIDNLRLERYCSSDSSVLRLAKQAYYGLRPWLSVAARSFIQRARLRDWRKLAFPHWPVDTTVEDLCEKLLLLNMESLGIERIPFVWFWPEGARCCVVMTHDVETEIGRDFCQALMDLDDAFGVKSSFQIVPEGRYAVPEELLATIQARGFELGIQDLNHDGRLFDDRSEFLRRVERINCYAHAWGANGFRAAVLYRKP